MTWRSVSYLLLAGIFAVGGCKSAGAPQLARKQSPGYWGQADAVPTPSYPDPTGQVTPTSPVQTPERSSSVQLASAVDSSQAARERILIYTASLQVLSVDIEASLAAAQKLCTDAGGYMDGMTQGAITMRVPAAKFFPVLEEIRKLGQVVSKSINAQDVTDEYVDLQLRLKNAEATRDRLLAILEKAQTVKDTLEVERELSRVREEIERIKGRLTLLDRQTAFSTITVNFMPPAPAETRRSRPPTPFAWLDSLGVEHVLQFAY